MTVKSSSGDSRAWMDGDSAMWHTIAAVNSISRREIPALRCQTLFALRPNEIAFATSSISIESMRTAGDGSYLHASTVAYGTGRVGLALLAGSLAGSAIGNAHRKAQAAAAAQVKWRPELAGSVIVTNLGFYLQDYTGVVWWNWESIDLLQVAGFNLLLMQGNSANGVVTWRLTGNWVELIFVLWALNRHPNHPQLLDGSWVPAHWTEWAATKGHPAPVLRQVTE